MSIVVAAVPLVRVFRTRRGERFDDARLRRAEIVTLDPADLRTVLSRCQTPFHRSEASAIEDAARSLERGTTADIFVAVDGRVAVQLRNPCA